MGRLSFEWGALHLLLLLFGVGCGDRYQKEVRVFGQRFLGCAFFLSQGVAKHYRHLLPKEHGT